MARHRRRRIKNPYRARRRRHNPESHRERVRAARSAWRKRRHNPESHRERVSAARMGWRHRKHNPFRHRRRRNPLDAESLTSDLKAAGLGAAAAVALDVILAYTPVPSRFTTGWGQVLIQGLGSVALGYLAGAAGGNRVGQMVTIGGLTVTGYGALQLALAPTLGSRIRGFGGLADFSDFRGGAVGAYMGRNPAPPRVGAYMSPAARLAPPAPAAAPAPSTSLAKKQMGAYMRSAAMGRFNGFGGLAHGNF